jgi:hypothetical protein
VPDEVRAVVQLNMRAGDGQLYGELLEELSEVCESPRFAPLEITVMRTVTSRHVPSDGPAGARQL